MELEYQTVMIDINPEYQAKVEALVADRWEVLPGTKPVAIYHLVRIKNQTPQVSDIGGFGTLKIDESKIHIIRDGKIVRPDGTIEGEGEGKIISGEAKLG